MEVPAASHLVDVCGDAATWDKRFTTACSENSHQDRTIVLQETIGKDAKTRAVVALMETAIHGPNETKAVGDTQQNDDVEENHHQYRLVD
ncbi:hypothetical protein STEG23_032734 [Scotinomys teguina]